MSMQHATRRRLAPFLFLVFVVPAAASAEPEDGSEKPEGSFAEATAGLTARPGFVDIYPDPEQGRVLALLPAPKAESGDGELLRFVHAVRLARGLGSNPLGLDRGWGNAGRIVAFRRIGQRVVAEVENHRYRADTENRAEREAVASSFAGSFVWATEIVAERDDGRVLIDLSGWLTADPLGLAEKLGEDGGKYTRAEDRSLPDVDSLLVFPDNVEIDAWMTFTGDDPGAEIEATAAEAEAVTLVQHHSLVRLPDAGYTPRRADPRTGTFTLGYYDYAAGLDEPIVRGYAMRHRLQYNEPGRPESGVREPLVFHVDPGAPKAVREALIEGASWWRDAFAAAGFADGFRVEVLPEGAHPLDIRYNVVQWVHRQTRGWSYGGAIIDPRTGEMIKGHVILGSQRVRQDRMIFEGLAGTDAVGSGRDDDPVELALDRIRQLAAHEVGHALGFGHNFAASSNDRASVMDYPAPWVRIDARGELDFSAAYDRGIGDWDRLTARWLYSQFAPGEDEAARLDAIVAEGIDQGLLFVADEHARSVSTAHPRASVWDNGDDAIEELGNVLAVRDRALRNFGPDRVAPGQPLAKLREVLVPIYLYHRYQLAAAAKSLGGVHFAYAERGGPGGPVRPVRPARQREALEALLETLDPDRLALPDEIEALLPPHYTGYWFDPRVETLPGRTDPAFDPFAAAEAAADLTFEALLDPARAERLVRHHARNPDSPSPGDVMMAVENRLFDELSGATGDRRVIAQRVLGRFAAALMELEKGSASGSVQGAARTALQRLSRHLERTAGRPDDPGSAWPNWLIARIVRHLERPAPARDPVAPAPAIPPGSPIGSRGATTGGHTGLPGPHGWIAEACWHCDN